MNEEIKSENLRIHSRADELIACLEVEIAKRDETIARLEPQLNRAIQANYDLREELAACRVSVENCEVFRARIAELEDDLKCAHSMLAEVSKAGMALRAELAALKAQEPVAWISKDGTYAEASTKSTVYGSHTLPLYVEPVPVENAQVVMPERWNVPRPMWKDARQPYGNPLNHADIEAAEKFNLALDEVARLNAAPVQQVSVPVACSCGREYPANSYSAGFISGSGMCEECDAAMPPKDIPQLVSVPDNEDWGVFFGYLIDKCEGHIVAEENLQGWLSEMLADPHYGALFRREKAPAEQPSPIARSIEAAEEEHGSLRAAAKALGIDPGYLYRLKSGEKINPSADVLKALGLERITYYRSMLAAAPAAPAADAWIPVSERLPAVESRLDQECRVGTLSIAPLNVSAAVLVFDGEKVRSTRLEWFDGCLPLPYCITHWMPLPAGPADHRAKGVV